MVYLFDDLSFALKTVVILVHDGVLRVIDLRGVDILSSLLLLLGGGFLLVRVVGDVVVVLVLTGIGVAVA